MFNYIKSKCSSMFENSELNKSKVVICLIITFVVVSVATIDGIFLFNKKNSEKYGKEIQEQAKNLENDESQIIVMQEAKKIEEIRSKIPTWDNLQAIRHIYAKTEPKQVFLTFDDGPSQSITIPILDLLKQEDIKVTFFVLGRNVERYPEITKRAYEEGHYIANHGYSHNYSSIYASIDAILDEYNHTENIIRGAIQNENYSSHLFRYPGGSVGGKYRVIKKEAKPVLEENQIFYLDWNALTKDAEGAKTREAQLNSLAETVGEKSSVVLLMHDAAGKSVTYESLPDIIKFFKDRDYEFKSIYDLMQ